MGGAAAGFASGLGSGLLGGYASEKQKQFNQQLQGQVATAETLMKMASMPSNDPTQPARLLGAAVTILQDPKKARKLNLHDLVNGPQGQPGAESAQPAQPQQAPPQSGFPMSSLPPMPGTQPQAQDQTQGQGAGGPFSGLNFLTQPQQEAQRAAAEQQATLAGRKNQAEVAGLKPGSEEYQRFMAPGALPPFAHLQAKVVTYPDGSLHSASFNPMSGGYTDESGQPVPSGTTLATPGAAKPTKMIYKGPNGEPLFGFQVGSQLYGQDQKPLPQGTQAWEASLLPESTTTNDIRFVQQPDGSTVPVPVTQTKTSQKGSGIPAPPGSAAPQQKTGVAKPQGAGGARVGAPGAPVGGKVPPEVKKMYDKYNSSVERYGVMSKALPDALHGDQQAMVNILFNHIGMTMGLQPGARQNQAIIEEAASSDPIVRRLMAKGSFSFDDTSPYGWTLRSGIVLTPEQMHSMIKLGKDRMDADKEAYGRLKEEAKSGYGMGGASRIPSPPSGGGATPKFSPNNPFAPQGP